jgi:hypothetical protein
MRQIADTRRDRYALNKVDWSRVNVIRDYRHGFIAKRTMDIVNCCNWNCAYFTKGAKLPCGNIPCGWIKIGDL